jgi:hypothetical protein
MDGTQQKSMQDFDGRNLKECIFEDNINLDPGPVAGGCGNGIYVHTQSVAGGIVNILGGGSMDFWSK